jgi:hypothetical protein
MLPNLQNPWKMTEFADGLVQARTDHLRLLISRFQVRVLGGSPLRPRISAGFFSFSGTFDARQGCDILPTALGEGRTHIQLDADQKRKVLELAKSQGIVIKCEACSSEEFAVSHTVDPVGEGPGGAYTAKVACEECGTPA